MSTNREIAINLMTDAAKAVGKSRGPQHGDAEPSFRMIGELWSTHINHALEARTGVKQIPIHISAWDVAQMMSMLKKARALYGDATLGEHYADDIGYTGLAGGLAGASGSTQLTDAVQVAAELAVAEAKAHIQASVAEQPAVQEPAPPEPGIPPVDPAIPQFLHESLHERKKNRA